MSEEPKKVNPRWDIIDKLYDAIDNSIVEISDKENMNFIEISMALHMINKKVEYEQFKAMFDFNVEVLNKEAQEGSPEGMYK
tara:strand:- start:368 stop:613 length:246 start_codon:yes stop_codon:yes gene_type:complete